MKMPEDKKESETGQAQLWPIFICYRQVDGLAAARRLHELLDKQKVTGPKGELILLDVYLDQTMPAVADWREIHRPYLEKARALIVVCTPGAKLIEGSADWVHKEIDWWLEHRKTVPILIDPLRQGIRYVPAVISERWPEIQRIPLVESEWISLPAAELEEKAKALRRQIVGNILPSGAAIYAEELEVERNRAEGLRIALQGRTRALGATVILLIVAGLASMYAVDKQDKAEKSQQVAEKSQQAAEISQRVSQAALHDAQAASNFAEARSYESQWDSERLRLLDLQRELSAQEADNSDSVAVRKSNLTYEIRQLDQTMKQLSAKAAESRGRGRAQLDVANQTWTALRDEGRHDAVARRGLPPEPPHIFSIELINAGKGESLLIHYGTPDATSLIMINSGTRPEFRRFVEPRLRRLKEQRFAGKPTPIELYVASTGEIFKTEGLLEILKDATEDRLVKIDRIWANLFATQASRGRLRQMIAASGIPLNDPFDSLVMRPDRGRIRYVLERGMEIVVIGPNRSSLAALHKYAMGRNKKYSEIRNENGDLGPPVADPSSEQFSKFKVAEDAELLRSSPVATASETCAPSENARANASVTLSDRSLPNLASTILLFRYQNRTFLHTGDSRADLIMEGLASSGLVEKSGRAHLDLLHIPHHGSNNNLTPEFLERVTADGYLFFGDGTHENPEIGTIASLVSARPCAIMACIS